MSTWIYHITHLKNLPSILEMGGLLANSQLCQQKIDFQDISYEQIQGKRARTRVVCGAGGNVHDYVPFYFAPRSPMLYTIYRRNVPGCPEGQNPVLHLVTNIEAIAAENLAFTFTDGHPVVAYSRFYDSLEDLCEIDWDIMEARYWNDTEDDGDRKRRRQAEFLIHEFLPCSLIIGIGVINAEIQGQAQKILQNMNQTTPVRVRRNWYY